MQLWFSRQSDISIREQLATQLVLAIVSGELAPGQRLPSTRELARRFRLHPNTVSAGYRQLEKSNWLEFRKGSGVYVNQRRPEVGDGQIQLDQLIGEFFASARKLKTPLSVVRARLKQWLEMQPPDHFLLIEPDEQLARIIVKEIEQQVALPVKSVSQLAGEAVPGAIPIVLSISAQKMRKMPAHYGDPLTLHVRSAGESLAQYLPVSRSILVGIASAWPAFLRNARTMLTSAGFHPDCLLLRDTKKPGWKRGLNEVAAVVCDSVTATLVKDCPLVLTFPLLSGRSTQELRQYEQFIRDPLNADGCGS